MPPKDYDPTQIFFKIENGEYQPIGNAVGLTAEPEKISDDRMGYFKRGEFSIELTDDGRKQIERFMKLFLKALEDIEKLLKRTFGCNNWRKMHRLPLIRRRGKRK